MVRVSERLKTPLTWRNLYLGNLLGCQLTAPVPAFASETAKVNHISCSCYIPFSISRVLARGRIARCQHIAHTPLEMHASWFAAKDQFLEFQVHTAPAVDLHPTRSITESMATSPGALDDTDIQIQISYLPAPTDRLTTFPTPTPVLIFTSLF